MDIGTPYLPPEVVCEVIGFLPKKDIKNVRLASKGLSVLGAHRLFQSVYISTKRKDMESFTSVSKHPVFSKMVKEVVYDSTNITFLEGEDHVSFNKTNYTRFLIGCDSSPRVKRSTTYTKAAVQRGFMSFLQNYEDQRQLAQYDADDLTHWKDVGSLPAGFQSHLMDPTCWSKLVEYLAPDLVCLIYGLPLLSRVKHFVISDNRYSQNVRHNTRACWHYEDGAHERTLSIKNKGIRGIDEVIIDPRPWPSLVEEWPPIDCDRSWYRGFFVLMQAASMINMATLESFKVKRDCGMSGLSQAILNMSPRELFHTSNSFSTLKVIQLKLHTGYLNGKRWANTVTLGSLSQILGAATRLEKLDLRLDLVITDDEDDSISFEALIGSHKWPNLHSITLSNMVLKPDPNGFIEFFNRHRESLHTLRLKQVMIQPADPLADPDPNVQPSPGNWRDTFVSMADGQLNLTNLTLQAGLSRHSRLTYFHSCNPATVLAFLRDGGQSEWGIQPRCVHMKHRFWPSKY